MSRRALAILLLALLAVAALPSASALPRCEVRTWGDLGVNPQCTYVRPVFDDGGAYCGTGFRDSLLWCGVSYDNRDGVDVRIIPQPDGYDCVFLLYNTPTGGENVVPLGCY